MCRQEGNKYLFYNRTGINAWFPDVSVAKCQLKGKPVWSLSRLGGCNQYLLSGQQWHVIYLQETITVFMYELNMPRRHHWRLHICNRSARKDWHTAVNSIQTWLGQIEEWMLTLWATRGREGKERYWQGISSPRAGCRAWKSMFLYLKGIREMGQTL